MITINRIRRQQGNAIIGGAYDLTTFDGGVNISITINTADFIAIVKTLADGYGDGLSVVDSDDGRSWYFWVPASCGVDGYWRAECEDRLVGKVEISQKAIAEYIKTYKLV